MKLTFTYRLVGRGWSEAILSDGVRHVTITASYLDDAITLLAEAVIALLQTANRASCNWADEPGEYRWLLDRRGDDLSITILWFDQTFSRKPDEAGRVVFSVEGTLRRFAVQLRNQLQELLERHGAEGYKQLWGYDFPFSDYEKLTSLIHASRTRAQDRA